MAFDPYGLLGVPTSATREEIRQAYRGLARKYHPDVNDSAEAVELFKEVGMAFAILNDDPRRALFDEFGEESMHINFDPDKARKRRSRRPAQAQHAGHTGRPQRAPRPRPRRSTVPPRRGSKPLRRSGRPRRQEPTRRPEPAPRGRPRRDSGAMPTSDAGRTADVVAPLEINLALALTGGEVRIPSPVGGAMISVRVPPNVQGGHRIRLVGRGRPGRDGARPGDLYMEVIVARHPYFHLEGDDLVLELPITVGEAHYGAEVEIPTPDGWLRIRVPRGSTGGESLRLRGKGKVLEGGQRGEMYVHLCVRLPSKVGAATRSLDHINRLYHDPIRHDLKL